MIFNRLIDMHISCDKLYNKYNYKYVKDGIIININDNYDKLENQGISIPINNWIIFDIYDIYNSNYNVIKK